MRWGEKHSIHIFEERLQRLPRSRMREFQHLFPRFCSGYEARFGRDRLTRIMFPLLEEALTKYPPKNPQKGYVGESIAAATLSLFMDKDETLFRNLTYYYEKGSGEIDIIIFNGPFISAIGEVKTGVKSEYRKNLSKARRHLREALGIMSDEEEIRLISKICLSVAKIETPKSLDSLKLDGGVEIYFLQTVRFFSVGPWDAHWSVSPTFKMPIHSEGIELLSRDMRKEHKKHTKNNHSKNRWKLGANSSRLSRP